MSRVSPRSRRSPLVCHSLARYLPEAGFRQGPVCRWPHSAGWSGEGHHCGGAIPTWPLTSWLWLLKAALRRGRLLGGSALRQGDRWSPKRLSDGKVRTTRSGWIAGRRDLTDRPFHHEGRAPESVKPRAVTRIEQAEPKNLRATGRPRRLRCCCEVFVIDAKKA